MKIIGIVIAAAGLLLGGCASKPTAESVQKDLIKAEEVRAGAEKKKMDQRQARNEEYIDAIPKWALEVPKPDAGGLYAVGSAESESWSVAQKKAMLDAEFGLAKIYKQELSGSERSYTQERNDKSLNTQYSALIDKLVARVPVVGFEVVKQEVKPMRGSFQSWVLLKLPYAQFNKVLQEQRAESMESTVRDAFDDLDKRVKARLDDRLRDQKAQQEMRLSEMNTRSDMARKDVQAATNGANSSGSTVTDSVIKTETVVKTDSSATATPGNTTQ